MIVTINNEEIDLGGAVIELTKQWIDFHDLSDRYLGRSNRIVLPKTETNIKILGRPCFVGSNNMPFEKYFKVNVIDDTIIFSGVGKLIEANQTYNLDLVENTKTFFDSLNVKLNELDYEDDDFEYGSTAYGTLKVPTSSVWLWPVSSMHENKKNTTFLSSTANGLKYNRPFFLVSNLVSKIFESQGWSLEIDDKQDKFPYLVLSSNHKQFLVTDYQKTINETLTGNDDLTGYDTNDFEESSISTTNTEIDIGTHEAKVRIRGNISVSSEYKLIVNGLSSPSGTDEQSQEFVIRENDTYIDFTTNVFKTSETSNEIYISVEGTGAITFDDTLLYTVIEEATLGVISGTQNDGFYVKTHDNLPDLTQINLFKNIWKLFGVGFISDSFNKSITAFSFRRLSKNHSVDWSDKFIKDSEIIETLNSSYAQTNYFVYSNDDSIDFTTGEASFEIDDNTRVDEKNIVTIDYSASNEVIIDTYTLLDMEVYDDDERINTLDQRIGVYYLDPTDTFSLVEFSPIDWSTIITDSYLNIVNSLQRIRYIEAKFVLSNLDFIGLDPTIAIYVEQLQGKYILQRVNSYIPGIPVTCELLKLE